MNGDRIRRAREAKGWSQSRLAAEAATNQAYISDLENDKRPNMEIATLQRIAAALSLELRITLEPVPTKAQAEVAPSAA